MDIRYSYNSLSNDDNLSDPNISDAQINKMVNDNFSKMVKTMTKDQLEDLLNNNDKLSIECSKIPAISLLENKKKLIIDGTIKIAQQNLDKKPLLTEKQNLLKEKTEKLNMLISEYDYIKRNFEEYTKAFNPNTIKKNLKSSIEDEDQISEAIIQDMLHKNLELEKFTDKYLEIRKKYHQLKIVYDKYCELTTINKR